jgi:hypothetical protein
MPFIVEIMCGGPSLNSRIWLGFELQMSGITLMMVVVLALLGYPLPSQLFCNMLGCMAVVRIDMK